MTEEYELSMRASIVEIDYDIALVKQFVALGGECLQDGNMFGAVIGDLPTGCSGFEKTRSKAIQTCMHNFYNEEAKIIPSRNVKVT